jgi:hypothetical protein
LHFFFFLLPLLFFSSCRFFFFLFPLFLSSSLDPLQVNDKKRYKESATSLFSPVVDRFILSTNKTRQDPAKYKGAHIVFRVHPIAVGKETFQSTISGTDKISPRDETLVTHPAKRRVLDPNIGTLSQFSRHYHDPKHKPNIILSVLEISPLGLDSLTTAVIATTTATTTWCCLATSIPSSSPLSLPLVSLFPSPLVLSCH